MSLETMTKLQTITSDGTATSVTFSNIPQGYTDLRFELSTRGTGTSTPTINMAINGSTAGITAKGQESYTGIASGNNSSNSGYAVAVTSATEHGTNTFANSYVYIAGYSGVQPKSWLADYHSEQNNAATYAWKGMFAGVWAYTSPITSVTFSISGGNLANYSSFTLYGIKALRTVMPLNNRASGGVITTDGTYTYHTFTNSNMFVANTNLTGVEILSVAGGGGANQYGGGGAGGVYYVANQSLLGSYPVVVGAGGRGAYITGNPFSAGAFDPSNGTDSWVGSLVHAVGGGASGAGWTGVGNGTAAQPGGSGGGGSARYTVGGASSQDTGGASNQTSVGGTGYGNAGGNGSAATGTASQLSGGGGGGAGGAGGNGTTTSYGAAGVGTTVFSTWGLATSTGQNSGGTYYYAGGGGAWSQTGGFGPGGLGGGGGGASGTALNGTASTGGGAGGGTLGSNFNASGGSGLVIIRYK